MRLVERIDVQPGEACARLAALARSSRRTHTLLVIDRTTLGQLIEEVGGEEQASDFTISLVAAARYPVAVQTMNESGGVETWLMVPTKWDEARFRRFYGQFRAALESLGAPVLAMQPKPKREN